MMQLKPQKEPHKPSEHDSLIQTLSPSQTVLFVIDVQNDFCHPDGEIGALGFDLSQVAPFIDNLQRLLESARSSRVPVLFTRDLHSQHSDSPIWIEKHTRGGRSPFPREGSWGAELFSAIRPLATERVIDKHRYSAFVGTGLDADLRAKNVDTVVVSGLYTHMCVESTVRHAHMLDYRVIVPRECVMRGSRPQDTIIHECSLDVMGYYFADVRAIGDITSVWSSY